MNKTGKLSKSIFVCPFCTVFTENADKLVIHLGEEHNEQTLRAFAEEQVIPKRKDH